MKKILILFMLFVPALLSAHEVLRVVYFPYPPNLIVDGFGATIEHPKGAIVDVWENYIAPKANVKIKWIGPYPFSRAMAMLESGEADVIQHLSRTPEREQKFIFSRHPIMWGRQGILVQRTEKMNKVNSVAELNGKIIGMIGEGYLAPFLKNNRNSITLEEVFGEDAAQKNIQKLISGRIWGVYFTFPDVLLYYASHMNVYDKVKVIPFPGSEGNEITFAAMSRKLDPAMVKRIDNAISESYQTYSYPLLMRKYFKKNNGIK